MMDAKKQELLDFLQERIYRPALVNPHSDKIAIRKVHCTVLRLRRLRTAKAIKRYFWSTISKENGPDSYKLLHSTDAANFEEARDEFEKLYGRH